MLLRLCGFGRRASSFHHVLECNGQCRSLILPWNGGEERDPYAHLSGTGDVQIADILRTIKHETHEEKKENKVINLVKGPQRG